MQLAHHQQTLFEKSLNCVEKRSDVQVFKFLKGRSPSTCRLSTEKKNHNCSAVNALVEILNYRFYTINKKSHLEVNCSEKFHAWQSLILVRKFQIIVPQLTPSPVFSEWFCETFQNNCHWLHYFFHFCQKIIKWLTKQILDLKIHEVVIN